MSASAAPDPDCRRLGDFEILREIGRGGMGLVSEARQISLNRRVALKVLAAGFTLSTNGVARFRREAEAAARLHHTNTLPVYATGEQDGTYYYAMELIAGPSLAQVIDQMRAARESPAKKREMPSPLDETGPYENPAPASDFAAVTDSSTLGSESRFFDIIARAMAEVADGLEHAHKHGVVHRDIKPSNLLLSPDGRLSVNDFGHARLLEEPGMTLSGEFVGTPRYMSPEQIAAGRTPLDHRTDIYSLGATLYELLTLNPPFTGERRDQVLAQILYKEPRSPRLVNRRVPVDLETICLKALEKDPDRHYQTAGAMAEDLRRYVNRFAIHARRAGPIRRLGKWVRRRPDVAAALGCAIVLALILGFFMYGWHASEQQREAEREKAREELLAEKRQNALDKALGAAMGGDRRETERAIGAVELAGTSIGQVRMLRGLAAFNRGDVEEAIEDLELAEALMPESVAARYILLSCYYQAGPYARIPQIMQEAAKLTPVTPEDYLFKGYALLHSDNLVALKLMDEAIRRHDSPVARALRSEIRSCSVLDTRDPKTANLAIADAMIAREMLPDNPRSLYMSVLANLAAATVYEEAGDIEKWRHFLNEARKACEAIDRFGSIPAAVFGRWSYCGSTDSDPTFMNDVRVKVGRQKLPGVTWCCALHLYMQGECKNALAFLDDAREDDHVLAPLKALILTELPDGSTRALEMCKKLRKDYPQSPYVFFGTQRVYWLLGHKTQALADARDFQKGLGRSLLSRSKLVLEYLCDQRSESDLLEVSGSSRIAQCWAHFWIGITRLADGDRKNALEHFRKARATRNFWPAEWDLSWAFQVRLKRDPAWPPWIPQKK